MPDDVMSEEYRLPADPAKRPPLRQGGGLGAIIPQDIDQVYRMAGMFVKGGFAPQGMNETQAAVAIMKGLEIGLLPVQAVQSIAVINNRPSIWGDIGIGLALNSGLLSDKTERIEGEGEDMVAICELKRVSLASPVVGRFSVKDAKTAKLWGKSGPWTNYPKRMLQNRARWLALRDGFADVLGGMHIAEEAQEIIGPDNARDITPPKRPTRDQYGEVTPAPIVVEEPRAPEFTVELPDGSAVSSSDPEEFAEDCAAAMRECRTTLDLDACRDVISTAFDALREAERDDLVLFLEDQTYYPLHDKLSAAERDAAVKRGDEINAEAAKSEGADTPEEADETDTSFLDEDTPERNWSVQPVRSEDGKMMLGPTFKSLRDMTVLCSEPEDWKAFVEANAEIMDKIAQARPENAAEIGMWKKGASA